MKPLHTRAWIPGLVVLIVALTGTVDVSADLPQITPSPSRAASMRHHFESVIGAVDAVVRGDVSEAKLEARLLLAQPAPTGIPDAGASHLATLRAQAERTSKAANLEQAAAAAASMLAVCGDCHRAVGTMPAFATPTEPTIGGVLGHMKQHKVAVDLLAEALATPSTSLWKDGADSLAAAPLHRVDLPDTAKISSAALAAEQTIHGLATRAKTTNDTPGRVRTFAQIIESCSTCHAANGRPGPTP